MRRALFFWAVCLGTSVLAEEPPTFEDAVNCIKRFEGWHGPEHYPYVGYGHCLHAGEKITLPLTERQGDSLLRADLRRKCALFRRFKQDSLLLGTLAYNVGEHTLLGGGKRTKSQLIRRLESDNRNIRTEYLSFRKYRGKVLKSLEERRRHEFELLFISNEGKDETEYLYTSGCFAGIVTDEAGCVDWSAWFVGRGPFSAGTPGKRFHGVAGKSLPRRIFMVYSPNINCR